MIIEPNIKIRTRLKPISAKIEITPLIDVLFLLLIFFMVSSSFFRISGISVELPELSNQPFHDVARCVITLEPDGTIFFNEHIVQLEKLKRNFQNLNNRNVNTIIIQADKDVTHGKVLEMMALAAEYELNSILATTSKKPINTELKTEHLGE